MQALIYSLLLFISKYNLVALNLINDESTYDVPRTAQYPFGDEDFCNLHALENDTNKLHCNKDKDVDLKKLIGKCPYEETEGKIMDPYIECPGYVQFPPPDEIIFSSGDLPHLEVQCRKCDLRLTSDNKAVIVGCFQCFDIPNVNRPANRTERDILYKTYFIEISNYTSVEVIGQENLLL